MAGAVGGLATAARLPGLLRSSRPLLGVCSTNFQPSCSIVSKYLRDPNYKRPAPFPYKEKKYGVWRWMMEDVTQRFDENTKIIVIDGPPTGNKVKLAKAIADELDMCYMPKAHLDSIYITEYGFDLRRVNHLMPESCRSFDIEDFLRNPKRIDSGAMQHFYFGIRFLQYIDAIEHLLNTGQGVVLLRSAYSDFVFAETMKRHGFMAPEVLRYYYERKEQGFIELLRPHLAIYLDIPVDKVISNVKARGLPHEQNSPFYTPEVLTTLENVYKQEYLRSISEHAEVLVYDWSEEGDAEVVVEDICSIDFDCHNSRHDDKLRDWRITREPEWKELRTMYSKYRDFFAMWFNVPRAYAPGLFIDGEDCLKKKYVMENQVPGGKYKFGFNKEMGDKPLFKFEW